MELVKRYTTVGMGPSQGRTGALAALGVAAGHPAYDGSDTVLTTQRPPFVPEEFCVLSGDVGTPLRRTAIHDWHLQAGAQMIVTGDWLRPAYYGKREQRAESIKNEVTAVGRGVGVIDSSTLGGMEIRGPDAADFMELFYTFRYRKQETGKSRYVLATDDAGTIVDDGVSVRRAEDLFYTTTTSTNSCEVYRSMLLLKNQHGMNVDICDVGASRAILNVAGAKARDVLRRLDSDLDFGPDAFPYLGVHEGSIEGIPALVVRPAFVSDLSFEIHVPAADALRLWRAILAAGEDFGILPFGVEAQRVLRLERGHIIVGQDTDAMTYPEEVGMSWAVADSKTGFTGQRSLRLLRERGLKRQLVGFRVRETGGAALRQGHLVVQEGKAVGRITSIAESDSIGGIIGLAYTSPDLASPGDSIGLKDSGGILVLGTVETLPFQRGEAIQG